MATKKEVISAAASESGYDGPTPQTIKDSILSLANALAGEDAGDADTIAEAIVVAASHAGGGGASVGALAWVSVSDVAPVANESYCLNISCYPIQTISVGDAAIIDMGNTYATADKVAAGAVVTTTSTFLEGSEGFYIVDVDAESHIVTGVEQATVTHETVTVGENKALRFTVPEVPSGKALWVKFEEQSS